MDQKRKQEMEKAGSYVVYLESEQADLDDHEHPFDAMWQSIYDVCKLVKFGIIDDITQEEFEEGYKWLVETKSLTENYQDFEMEF
ncbi:hypothetical protein H5999_11575 [[Clostridium] spiroforme]|nr:hypothetical protein [Thomasclavelia spiroformis]MBM6931682.1 hypothetical protein [Thomasclavelia spiroformis]